MTTFFGCLATVRSAHTSSFCWKHPIFWYRSHCDGSGATVSTHRLAFYHTIASESWLVRLLFCVHACVYVCVQQKRAANCTHDFTFSKSYYQTMKVMHEQLDSIMLVTCKHLMLFYFEITTNSSILVGTELHSHIGSMTTWSSANSLLPWHGSFSPTATHTLW